MICRVLKAFGVKDIELQGFTVSKFSCSRKMYIPELGENTPAVLSGILRPSSVDGGRTRQH